MVRVRTQHNDIIDIAGDDEHRQRQLARHYHDPATHGQGVNRLTCLCRGDHGPALVIRRRGRERPRYHLARMPGTHADHSPRCDYYTEPREHSGRQVYAERVTQEHEGGTRLSLAFDLSRPLKVRWSETACNATRYQQRDGDGPASTMSLTGLLCHLWDDAEINRWSPRMAGKRDWWVVRRELQRSAEDCTGANVRIGERLWVPPPFRRNRADEVNAQRAAFFERFRRTHERAPRCLVIGLLRQWKDDVIRLAFEPGRYYIDEVAAQAFLGSFGRAYNAVAHQPYQHDKPVHGRQLVLMMLVEVDGNGHRRVMAMAGLRTTPEYLPVESNHEETLVEALVSDGRRFIKPLRFDAAADIAFPDALLLDSHPVPYPLEVYGLDDPDYAHRRERKETHYREQYGGFWAWDAQREPLPALPPKHRID